MFPARLLLAFLAVATTVAAASGAQPLDGAAPHSGLAQRGVHRRHHARNAAMRAAIAEYMAAADAGAAAVEPEPAHTRRRRACTIKTSTAAAHPSTASAAPHSTVIAVGSSVPAVPVSSKPATPVSSKPAIPVSSSKASAPKPSSSEKPESASSVEPESSSEKPEATTSAKPVSSSDKPEPTTSQKASTHAPSYTKPASSSAQPASTGAPSGGSSNALVSHLFPGKSTNQRWTTVGKTAGSMALSDVTLRPFKAISELKRVYQEFAGKQALRAHYPAGSWNFQQEPRGGLSFYAPGPSSVDLTTAKEATFGYSVYFPEGFDFVMGGKLPGIYGGNDDDGSISCSGGARKDECFSARLMWRTKGAGELYTYLPPSLEANQAVCDIPPFSECNPTYGASVGRGSFQWATGAWTTVSQRVRLNDVGKANGEIELFANGESVVKASGLMLRDSSAGRMRGIQFQTFFGGSTNEWASPKDQDTYFADLSLAITEKL